MKQKLKNILLTVAVVFYAFLPVLSYAANLDNPTRGLVVCGNGVGAQSIESAIQGLYAFHNDPPSPNAAKYNQAGKFDEVLYKKDFETYKTKAGWTAEQQNRIDEAWRKFGQNSCQFFDIFRQIVKLINYLIAFASIFFVVRIVFEGAQMVVNAGNEKAIKSARENITSREYN
jgi:hypothetical protein